MPIPSFWQPEGFGERFDQWASDQGPSEDLRLTVIAWTLARFDDPYRGGVRRVPDFDNLWFGPIPGTEHDGSIVTCGYWIFEEDRRIRCDSYATLSLPL